MRPARCRGAPGVGGDAERGGVCSGKGETPGEPRPLQEAAAALRNVAEFLQGCVAPSPPDELEEA